MKTLIINIKQLVQVEEEPRKWVAGADMAKLGIIDDAYLLINEDKIEAFGKMSELNQDTIYEGTDTVKEIDAKGRLVLPAYCDSHTHIVYAGSREIEYIDKIKGLSYEEIAQRGGGILNSAERIRKASEEELFDSAYAWRNGRNDCDFGAKYCFYGAYQPAYCTRAKSAKSIGYFIKRFTL